MDDRIVEVITSTRSSQGRRVLLSAFMAVIGISLLAACSQKSDYQPGSLSNSTPCGVLNADQSAGDSTDITNFILASNPYLAANGDVRVQIQGEMDVLPHLLGECQNHPDELLAAAYNKAVSASLTPQQTSTMPSYNVETSTDPSGCVYIDGQPVMDDIYCEKDSR